MSYSYIVTVNIILQTNKLISIVIERGRGVLGSGNKSKQSLLQLDAVASALRKKVLSLIAQAAVRWCCARIYEQYLVFT